MEVYTFFSNPFTIGGTRLTPKKMEIETEYLGEFLGIKFYGFDTPKGYRVAEENGGIVSDSFSEVCKDLEHADMDVVKKQMEQSKLDVARAELISKEEFLRKY